MKKRAKNPIGLMVHCSDSPFGNVEIIRQWHKEFGWDDIGYNWIITNGIYKSNDKYNKSNDGIIQAGRPIEYIGAHAIGYNESHLSVCLIGVNHFSLGQIFSLTTLIKVIQDTNMIDYFIPGTVFTKENFLGHYEVDKKKTCPNMDMTVFRKLLGAYLREGRNGNL